MTLWTIQSLPAWTRLESRGVLVASSSHGEKEFLPAYRWMRAQMRRRLGPPPSAECFPLWAWSQWENSGQRRPDLRSSGHLPRGETGVLVELAVDEREALLSDFELWHYVLNYWYLPRSEADEARFDALLASLGVRAPSEVPRRDRRFHAEVRESWVRIFDIRWSARGIGWPPRKKSIQATLWSMSMEMVRSHRVFTAR